MSYLLHTSCLSLRSFSPLGDLISLASQNIDEMSLTIVEHRLGRTCIHKVGQYYVKPGQIQTVVAEEDEEGGEEKPLKGGLERSDDEEGVDKESLNPGQIHTSEEGVEEPLARVKKEETKVFKAPHRWKAQSDS